MKGMQSEVCSTQALRHFGVSLLRNFGTPALHYSATPVNLCSSSTGNFELFGKQNLLERSD